MSSAPLRIQTAPLLRLLLHRRHVRRRDPMLFFRPTASAVASEARAAARAVGIARRWNREPASGIHKFSLLSLGIICQLVLKTVNVVIVLAKNVYEIKY